MAKIKSYTDINQSRKLAEILPIESADMYYHYTRGVVKSYYEDIPEYIQLINHFGLLPEDIPCWSLAAMLERFKDAAGLARDFGLWFCYCNRKLYSTKHYDNPIDACYEMILKSHELKVL